MTTTYQFLLFDLDHTLLDFEAGEAVALGLLLEELGFADKEAFLAYYKPMNQSMWKALERREITKSELVNTRFSKAFAHFGLAVDGSAVAERFQYYMSQQGQTFAGAADLLAQLAAKGYQIYGATNGITRIQQGRLQASPIRPYFAAVFISEQLGTQKPDTLFFDKIAEQIPGFERSQAVMIGDSLTADIQGGQNAGLDTIWYNPSKASNTSGIRPTYEVATYDELLRVLETREEMTND